MLPDNDFPKSMTLQKAKSIARHLKLTLRQVRSGEYRVNFRDGNETTAYYTSDLEDAINTAVEMARKRELPAWPKPDPHCRQSSCASRQCSRRRRDARGLRRNLKRPQGEQRPRDAA
jgi:hypothetical protein